VIDPAGRLTPINLAGLRELIGQHFCGVRVVKNGAGWRREYFEYPFDTQPHPGPPRAADHGKRARCVSPTRPCSMNFIGTNCCGGQKLARDLMA